VEIGFVNLKVSCIIGVLEHERHREQILEADLAVEVDVSQAVASDDVSLTVGYDDLAEQFISHAKNGRYLLVETLVSEYRALICRSYPQIDGGVIEVRKPAAIPMADAAVVRLRW
jgi:dihydroneopterin aldolase